MISRATRDEIHGRCSRRRGLLESCVEADGSPTFTPDEVDTEVEDFCKTLTYRAHRGLELVPAHE